MGEQDRGVQAERVAVSYWDALGNEVVRYFSATLPDEEIPETVDSPSSGLPAGRVRVTGLSHVRPAVLAGHARAGGPGRSGGPVHLQG